MILEIFGQYLNFSKLAEITSFFNRYILLDIPL